MMQLGRLIPRSSKVYKSYRLQSPMSKLETAKGVFYKNQNLSSEDRYNFYVNLIHLFDIAILENNLFQLSREQQKLLERYFTLADTIVTAKTTTMPNPIPDLPEITVELDVWEYDFDLWPIDMDQLDVFLGSYLGDYYDYDHQHREYTKYGDKRA